MPKKTAKKETIKKGIQVNSQIKRNRKQFELENETSQVGLKIKQDLQQIFRLPVEIKSLLKK